MANINLDPGTHRMAMAKAVMAGTSLTAVIEAFLDDWLDGKLELPSHTRMYKGAANDDTKNSGNTSC